MNTVKTSLYLFAFYVIGFLAAAGGWIANIVKLCHMTGWSGLMCARLAGVIVPPLGAVMGYI